MASLGWMALQTLLPALSGFGVFGSLGISFSGITIGMVDIKQKDNYDNNIKKILANKLKIISDLLNSKRLDYKTDGVSNFFFYISELGPELGNQIVDNDYLQEVFNDFIFLDNLIRESKNPLEKFYFKVCFEVMKSYSMGDISPSLRRIFGTDLQIEQTNRPLPVTYISKILGMGRAYITDLLQRAGRNTQMRPFINFKTFVSKMQPSLTRVFGEEVTNDLIEGYLKGEGSRFYTLYTLYKLLYEKTGTTFSTEDFSEIMFGQRSKSQVLLRTPTPAIRDLDTMWGLEYGVTHINPRPDLGFNPDTNTLEDLMSESKKIVRENFISQLPSSLSPVTSIMILESLHALSDQKGSKVSLGDLSEVIDRHGSKLFLISKVFGAGRNPHDDVAKSLLTHLIKEGVGRDHMAVQFTEMFLNTRGLAFIDFDFYLKELNLASNTRQASKSVLSVERKYMAKTIVWGLTAGRSWITGEKMFYDESILHHIRHGANGRTLYGGTYDTLKNFAAVTHGENVGEVEGKKRQYYEDLFIYMWDMFKQGKFKEATMHWEDNNLQMEYLREVKSKSFLSYWLGKI